jgi:hypothetical protein
MSSPFPIACQIESLTVEERATQKRLWAHLAAHAREIKEHETGYSLRFGARESLSELALLMLIEARCCPFLSIRVEYSPDESKITLFGPAPTKDILRAQLHPTT